MKVTYDSNNSGGGWWLKDKDWQALESAGWNVHWVADDPFYKGKTTFLGALAMRAEKEFPSVDDATREWESITKQDAEAEGCSCCGAPHWFYGND